MKSPPELSLRFSGGSPRPSLKKKASSAPVLLAPPAAQVSHPIRRFVSKIEVSLARTSRGSPASSGGQKPI